MAKMWHFGHGIVQCFFYRALKKYSGITKGIFCFTTKDKKIILWSVDLTTGTGSCFDSYGKRKSALLYLAHIVCHFFISDSPLVSSSSIDRPRARTVQKRRDGGQFSYKIMTVQWGRRGMFGSVQNIGFSTQVMTITLDVQNRRSWPLSVRQE